MIIVLDLAEVNRVKGHLESVIMNSINIGLIGFGVVGSGVYSILRDSRELLAEKCGVELNITKIAVRDAGRKRNVDVDSSLLTTNPEDIVNDPDIHIVAELIGGVDIPYTLVEQSITNGKHVVTANKALLATHGHKLFSLARDKRVTLAYEASVAGGIPIIRTIKQALAGDHIRSLYGIINGTSNYILTRMVDEGMDFDTALSQAQELGFAEADPTLDVNGGDAAHKIAILAALAYNTEVDYTAIYYEGIENIALSDIFYAQELGYTLKLLGIASEEGDNRIAVRVHPALIEDNNPLSGIKNEYNAVLIDSEYLGKSLYSGKGAGMYPTANAVVGDIIDIAKGIASGTGYNAHQSVNGTSRQLASLSETSYQYYIRFNTLDKPGILARIAGIFSENNISIARVIQKGKHKADFVHLVLETHKALERDVNHALTEINKLNLVDPPGAMIRIVS